MTAMTQRAFVAMFVGKERAASLGSGTLATQLDGARPLMAQGASS